MTRSDIAGRARALGPAARGGESRPLAAASWMAAAFLVSLGLAAIALAVSGTGEHGTALALRLTARWCFLLFWPAYAGGALARFCAPHLRILARHGRDFGLAFAAALAVHVGLVIWLLDVAADQRSPMLFFWVGVLCTYALALLSLPRLREWLGPRLWRIGMELALQYIMLVFAVDFIGEPLRAGAADKYPLSYLPFAVMLVAGAALRFANFAPPRALAAKA